MGRSQGARDKWRYEVESVRRKSFECRLHQLVREEYGVCEAEAVSVVRGCLDYLRLGGLAERGPLDIRADVPAGRELWWKVSARSAAVRPVLLSPLAADDVELMLEAGVRAVQSARAVRLVEQADRAGCTMPLALLTSLVHLGTRTVSRRLEPLWEQGVHLPVVGIPRSGPRGRRSRRPDPRSPRAPRPGCGRGAPARAPRAGPRPASAARSPYGRARGPSAPRPRSPPPESPSPLRRQQPARCEA